MAGDFNLPSIDWDNYSVKPNAQYGTLSKQFLDIVSEFSLEQVVTKPTRLNNILDFFLTNNSTLVESSSVFSGISDHDGIPFISINVKPKLAKFIPRKVFMWNIADINAIKRSLKNSVMHFLPGTLYRVRWKVCMMTLLTKLHLSLTVMFPHVC